MIGALPRADVRSANGQAHIEYTFGVNGTVPSASSSNKAFIHVKNYAYSGKLLLFLSYEFE